MQELKKSNFLMIFKNEDNSLKAPMSKGELVDALEDYTFIDSWLIFLLESYVGSEKLTKATHVDPDTDEETVVYQLNRKKSGGNGGPREAWRIVWQEVAPATLLESDEEWVPKYGLESKTVGGSEPLGKDDGWAGSISAAAKRGRQAVFATYKEQTAAINAVWEANKDDDEGEEGEEIDEAA